MKINRRTTLTTCTITDNLKINGKMTEVILTAHVSMHGISFESNLEFSDTDMFFTHDEMNKIMEEAKRFKEEK